MCKAHSKVTHIKQQKYFHHLKGRGYNKNSVLYPRRLRWWKYFCCFICVTLLLALHITGSAVALHCCKAHAKINGKIENSTPCEIVTHEDFNLKLGTRDYVAEATHHATSRLNRPSGGFPPNRGNITPVWLFWLYCFFSRSYPQVKPSYWSLRWMAQMTCFRPRKCLLGVRTMGDVIGGKYPPKTPQKGAWLGSFKQKRQNLYIAISPELLIGRSSDLRTEFRPRKTLRG